MTTLETIRTNVKQLAENICALKSNAQPHICPKHPNWHEYTGRKFEATKWLIMLHLHKFNAGVLHDEEMLRRISSHVKESDQDEMIKICKKALNQLEDKMAKAAIVKL